MMIVWLVSAGLLGLHAVSGLPQSTPDTSSRAPDQSKASGQGWSLAATLLAGSSILYNVKNGIDNFSRRRAHVQRTKAALGRQRQRLNDKFSAKLQRFGTEMEAWRNGQALANNGIDGVTGRLSLVEQKLNGVDNDVTQLAMMHDEVDARTDALQKVGRHEKSLVVKSRDGEYHLAADPALDRCLQGIMEAMLYTVTFRTQYTPAGWKVAVDECAKLHNRSPEDVAGLASAWFVNYAFKGQYTPAAAAPKYPAQAAPPSSLDAGAVDAASGTSAFRAALFAADAGHSNAALVPPLRVWREELARSARSAGVTVGGGVSKGANSAFAVNMPVRPRK